jgi:XTP/dITP diphosphohydrolase
LQPGLLLATGNPGKARELKVLLEGIPFDLVLPQDIGLVCDIEETGATYQDNACIKALAMAKKSGLITLADDSGLEVDALGGEPGVYSSRFGGQDASDRQKIQLLVERLEGVPPDKRSARFVCVVAVAEPQMIQATFTGECNGYIAGKPRGKNHFGYDPIFIIPELGTTMAELTENAKNRYGHRAKAVYKARSYLMTYGK